MALSPSFRRRLFFLGASTLFFLFVFFFFTIRSSSLPLFSHTLESKEIVFHQTLFRFSPTIFSDSLKLSLHVETTQHPDFLTTSFNDFILVRINHTVCDTMTWHVTHADAFSSDGYFHIPLQSSSSISSLVIDLFFEDSRSLTWDL